MNIIRNSLLSLAAVGAFAFAGAAQASGGVIYQGTTTLTDSGGLSATCTLTLAGTIDSSGNITVDSAGSTGSATCAAIFNGGFPWTGTTSGSTLSTGSPSTILYSGGVLGTCGGTVTGISYGSGSPPSSVTITGTNNYGGSCTIDGTLALDP